MKVRVLQLLQIMLALAAFTVAAADQSASTKGVTIKVDTALPTSPGYHVMKGTATAGGKEFPIAFGINLQKEYFFSKDNYPVMVSLHNGIDSLGGFDGTNGLLGEGMAMLFVNDIGADNRHSGEWPPVKFNPRKEAQFIGIAPQCPSKKDGFQVLPNSAVVVEIVNWAEKNFRVDSDRCYLTGFSYGGFCTWAVGLQFPERWAAIIPLSARLAPYPEKAPEVLKDVGVWCGVGELDGDFKAACTKMNEVFTAAKHPNFHFTVIKGGQHHCYQSIYGNPEFWKWLLAQKRKAGTGAAPVTAAVEKK